MHTATQLGLTVRLNTTYEVALTRVIEALKTEGFGVLTEIDVQATLKQKLRGVMARPDWITQHDRCVAAG